jgi:hypothetical protein
MDPQSVDCRADIYGLGYTFYFLLTGRRPFPKTTVMEILTAHQVEKHEPVAKFRPDVPLELEAIIDKMTAKLPLQRYQTAKEVAEKLRAWLHESESGRTSYSRISALMAEAARAKQSSGDSTVSAPKATNRTEFEFATLDDLPSPSSSTVAAKSSASAVKKSSPAAKVTKEQNHQTVARKIVPPVAKRPAAKLAKSPSGRLLPDDLISALPPPEALSPASGSLPGMALRQVRKENTFEKLLRSPWPWVGLGGAVGLALLVFLIVFLTSSSPPPRVADRSEPPEPLVTGAETFTPSPSPTVVTPPAPPAGVMPEATAGKQAATPPAVQNGKAPAGGPSNPSPSAPALPQSMINAALADLSEVRLDSGLQPINPSLVRFYPAVGLEAVAAVEQRLKWHVVDKTPAALVVDLKADENSASPGVMLQVELKYSLPDGKHFTLWKGTKRLVSVDLSVITASTEQHYKEVAAKNTAELFTQFVDDILHIRAQAKRK